MLVARAGLSPVMVGRVRELSRLQHLAGSGSEPRVALIRGEAGVGKTRLIEEMACGLARDVPLLLAQAEQFAMCRPYELLLDAVAPAVAAWSRVPTALRRWEDALGVLLGPVAPHLAAADRGYASDELARAGTELVRHLIGNGPGVVVFEDLHWADAESLGLFHRLAVAPGLPVLLIGSYRPEDLDRRHVTDLVAIVERQREVHHLVLDRLSILEVSAMVAAVREGPVLYATAAALHRRTGGNPFFLEELLVAAGEAPVDVLADLPLPVTLTEAVLRHLEGLDPEQRRVVDAASALGQRIPFDLLASVTGLGENVLIGVLRDLVGQGLIAEDEPDVFSFRHALTREAVAGRLLARERRRINEKCLAALQESGSDDWGTLAHHAAGASRWEEMVAFARRGAAHYLRTGATYQALRLAELALDQADTDLELLELAARAAWSVGLPASALERAEQWRRLAEESDDPADLTRALRLVARLRWEAEDTTGHRAAVEAARVAAERLPVGEERAWVANLLAESAMLADKSSEAVEWADEALAFGGTSPSPVLRAAVLVNKGSALNMMSGREEEGERLLLEGLEAAVAVEDYHSALRAVNNLADSVFPVWQPERSAALLDQMGVLIERGGRQDFAGNWHGLTATFLAHVLGDLPAARAETELGGVPGVCKRASGAFIRAELALEAGDDAEAERMLALVGAPDGSTPDEVAERCFRLSLMARIAARRQSLTAVEEILGQLLAEVTKSDDHNFQASLAATWHHAVVSALHAGLTPSVAASLVPVAVPASRSAGDPGWPDHLSGAFAEAEGRLADAVVSYEAAVADRGWRRSPPAVADAHLGAGRCLLHLDRRDEAREHALVANALLERWPGWRQDDARALLRRLGRGEPVTNAPASLTGRELEVAVLVAEGLTNGEIATRLYISTKTASVHVSNILRKLDMSGRAELAAWVVREGLAG